MLTVRRHAKVVTSKEFITFKAILVGEAKIITMSATPSNFLAATRTSIRFYFHSSTNHEILSRSNSNTAGAPVQIFETFHGDLRVAQSLHSPLHCQPCTPPDYPSIPRGEGSDPIGSFFSLSSPIPGHPLGDIVQGKNYLLCRDVHF